MPEETPKKEEKGSGGGDLEKEKAELARQRKQEFGELTGKALTDTRARKELEKREREERLAEKIELRKTRPGWDPTYFKRVEERRKKLRKERETKKKKGKWFKKIPTEVLLSPGGMVLIFFAFLMEVLDIIPIPFIDQLWELPLELIFLVLLTIIAKVPLKTSVIPFVVERIPIINDILPTWLIRMLG